MDLFSGILGPKLPSAKARSLNQPAVGNSVSYSYAPEPHGLLYTHETPRHSGMSSLIDSGCFKSPADEFPSLCIVDDFDTLIRQLKSIGNVDLRTVGNMDSAISSAGSPPVTYLRDLQHTTVPYFPPVTSALRREQRMFRHGAQSSCVEYADDDLASPQELLRDHAISSDDLNFTSSGTDLRTFEPPPPSESLVTQFCSQSCPDVYSPAAADVHHRSTSPTNHCFDGQYISNSKTFYFSSRLAVYWPVPI